MRLILFLFLFSCIYFILFFVDKELYKPSSNYGKNKNYLQNNGYENQESYGDSQSYGDLLNYDSAPSSNNNKNYKKTKQSYNNDNHYNSYSNNYNSPPPSYATPAPVYANRLWDTTYSGLLQDYSNDPYPPKTFNYESNPAQSYPPTSYPGAKSYRSSYSPSPYPPSTFSAYTPPYYTPYPSYPLPSYEPMYPQPTNYGSQFGEYPSYEYTRNYYDDYALKNGYLDQSKVSYPSGYSKTYSASSSPYQSPSYRWL